MIADRRGWLARMLDICSPSLAILGRCPCRRCSAARSDSVLRARANAARAWEYGKMERERCHAKCQRAATIIRAQQAEIETLRGLRT